ncbi:MAG: MinD/ParA family protein [Actinomycetota bacterium]
MTKIVSVHSFRGGTGKSNTSANLAALIASSGRKVAVMDTDIQSPGIHALYGFDTDIPGRTLNNYLWGDCPIVEAAHDVTDVVQATSRGVAPGGQLWLVPSSIKASDIARVLRQGYDVEVLNEGVRELADGLALDVLIIDTHPGLNEETLLSITISDTWRVLLPEDVKLKAAVFHELAQTHELIRARIPKIGVAFGIDDPAFAAAYEKAARRTLDETFVPDHGAGARLRKLFGRGR